MRSGLFTSRRVAWLGFEMNYETTSNPYATRIRRCAASSSTLLGRSTAGACTAAREQCCMHVHKDKYTY